MRVRNTDLGCPFCGGKGFFYIATWDGDVDAEDCEDCHGTGWSRRALRLWKRLAGRVTAWVW
jgi:DnaJ-class molecular chaperone